MIFSYERVKGEGMMRSSQLSYTKVRKEMWRWLLYSMTGDMTGEQLQKRNR